MKKVMKLIVAIFTWIAIAACQMNVVDSEIAKIDFVKFQQWSESVESLEQDLIKIKPKDGEEALKLLNDIFDQAISQARALELQHAEVKLLRDKVIEGLGYQRIVMQTMIAPKHNQLRGEEIEDIYRKTEKLAEETEILYKKLEKELSSE